MGLVLAIYIVLLIIFLVTTAMIFRHTIKFGYLSPQFKIVVVVFGVLALIGVIVSFYLVVNLFRTPSAPTFDYPSVSTPSDIQF
jgi:hypothetical protein